MGWQGSVSFTCGVRIAHGVGGVAGTGHYMRSFPHLAELSVCSSDKDHRDLNKLKENRNNTLFFPIFHYQDKLMFHSLSKACLIDKQILAYFVIIWGILCNNLLYSNKAV